MGAGWLVGLVGLALVLVAVPGVAAPVTQMGAPAAAPDKQGAAVAPAGPPAVAPAAAPVNDGASAAPAAGPPAPVVPVTPAPVVVPSPPSTPIPTSDAVASASDHDAVVGHWGIEARRVSAGPYPLALRPTRGCPSTTPACTVDLGLIGVRTWIARGLAINAGLALALGGGKEGSRTLDSYVGGGPLLGLTVLLGNWRHLAVGASPELGVYVFKPGGGSTKSTVLIDLRAVIEGELHFGFISVPALSVGMASGLGFRYESTPDASVWSIGVVGPTSAWGVLTNLFVRYYL